MRSDALLRLAEAREDFSGSVELAERALAEAEGDPARAAAAENALAILWLVLRADLLRALQHHTRGVRFAEQADDPVRLALNLAHMAHLESLTGRITPGLLERGVRLEEELGILPDYGPLFVLGLRLMYRDRLDEARERLLRVGEVATEQGDEPRRAYVLFHLGELDVGPGTTLRPSSAPPRRSTSANSSHSTRLTRARSMSPLSRRRTWGGSMRREGSPRPGSSDRADAVCS